MIPNELLAAERAVEQRSTALRKELRLIDLVGMQLLNIVGLFWVGTAGKLGSSHVMYWIPAVVLFYVPSGIIVAHLVKEMPLEGGLYQWSKLRFGAGMGFLVGVNLWVQNLLIICKTGVMLADNAAYALGPSAAWLSTSKMVIIGASVLTLVGMMLIAWRGLSLGKWISNLGGGCILFLFLAMIIVAIPRWLHFGGSGPVAAPVALTVPAFTLLNLNLLGKMGFGAFGGFDQVGIFAGECRSANAAVTLRRSVWLAAPPISLMFIAGTASVLAFSRPETIDLVSPITQVFHLGAPVLAAAAALLFVLTLASQNVLSFSQMVRLPMVAGWDHLLPTWFSRLDPRYRTPTGSILFAGTLGLLLSVLANVGAGNQEAFQLLDNTGGILYGLTYLVMFAIPLLAPGERPGLGVQLAAASGLAMTLLYVALAVFPIVDVASPLTFAAKIIVTVLVLQLTAVAYYRSITRGRVP